ncbi:MAG: hypothetical protein LBP28_01115 [Coriobacteriales bacterium]|nr:hypothetical protein [Coriobacteriales bacterium]
MQTKTTDVAALTAVTAMATVAATAAATGSTATVAAKAPSTTASLALIQSKSVCTSLFLCCLMLMPGHIQQRLTD